MRSANRTVRIAVFIAITLSALLARASVSAAEYRSQLHDLAGQITSLQDHPESAGAVETGLKETVTVETGTGEIVVDFRPLKNDLAQFRSADAGRRETLLSQMEKYVDALTSGAAEFDRPSEDFSARRAKLAEILARREFHHVSGPSLLDLVLNKVLQWLARILGRFLRLGSSTVTPLHIFIYALIGAALILMAVWTIRRLRRGEEAPQQREIIPFAPSARGWRAWLGDARSLAANQDWRNAIHMAYWAGISFLEEHGAWRPNRARTPREYLGLVNPRTAQHAPLTALTRKFEFVWYGAHEALESDFQETLRQLETLGCR